MDIVGFMTARLDEEQAAAKAAIADRSGTERWEAKGFPERDRIGWIVRDVEEKYASHGYPGYTPVAAAMPGGPRDGGGVAEHIARHDPAHVLADVNAKRALVNLHEFQPVDRYFPPDKSELPEGYSGTFIGHCALCSETNDTEGLHNYYEPWPCPSLRILANVDAEHPDYNPAWAVS